MATRQHQRPRQRSRHRDHHRPAHAAGGGPADPAQVAGDHRAVHVSRSSRTSTPSSPPWPRRPTDLAKATTWTPLTATSSGDKVTVNDHVGHLGRRALLHRRQAPPAPTSSTSRSAAALTDVVVPRRARGKNTVTLTVGGTPKTVDAGDGTLGVARRRDQWGRHRRLRRRAEAGRRHLPAHRRVDRRPGPRPPSRSPTTTAATCSAAPPSCAGRDAAITIGARHRSTRRPTPSPTSCPAWTSPSTDRRRRHAPSTVDGRPGHQRRRSARPRPSSTRSTRSSTDIETQTKYNATTKASGALAGDATVREPAQRRCSTRSSPATAPRLADVGIQTDRYGKLVFDADEVRRRRTPPTPPPWPRSSSGTTGFAARIEDGRHRRQRQVRRHRSPPRSPAAPPASTASTTASRPGTTGSSCGDRRSPGSSPPSRPP